MAAQVRAVCPSKSPPSTTANQARVRRPYASADGQIRELLVVGELMAN
jgi:hypothetical protein